jgi:hypothetical protein
MITATGITHFILADAEPKCSNWACAMVCCSPVRVPPEFTARMAARRCEKLKPRNRIIAGRFSCRRSDHTTVHQVDASATAFRFRNAGWAAVIVRVDPDRANAERIKEWTVSYWEALRATSLGGGHVNFMMDEGADRVRASYGENYDKLARIKAKYDPGNFFHIRTSRRAPDERHLGG